MPKFKGEEDPNAYIDWELKVEKIFRIHNYSEEKKVAMASLEGLKANSEIITVWKGQGYHIKRKLNPVSVEKEMHTVEKNRTEGL